MKRVISRFINRFHRLIQNISRCLNILWQEKYQWIVAKRGEVLLFVARPFHAETSWWRHQMGTFSVLLALCASASLLFTQPFIQEQIKENIKVLRHCVLRSPLTGEFPARRASKSGTCFHLMTSSWFLVFTYDEGLYCNLYPCSIYGMLWIGYLRRCRDTY